MVIRRADPSGILALESPQLQILGPVIVAPAVLVMHALMWFKRATEGLREDKAVLLHPSATVGHRMISFDFDSHVAMRQNLPRPYRGVSAFLRTEPLLTIGAVCGVHLFPATFTFLAGQGAEGTSALYRAHLLLAVAGRIETRSANDASFNDTICRCADLHLLIGAETRTVPLPGTSWLESCSAVLASPISVFWVSPSCIGTTCGAPPTGCVSGSRELLSAVLAHAAATSTAPLAIFLPV